MNIFIINCGSSSLRYQLLKMPRGEVTCEGLVERIGSAQSILNFRTETFTIAEIHKIPNHKTGLQKIAELLFDAQKGVLSNPKEIDAVGHRVVHGGNTFSKTTLITKKVKVKIKELSVLAPLHNPHNLEGILLAEQLFPHAKQIAVFDTAFHKTMPVKAKKYALPNELFTRHGMQVYGFHGISHKYVSEKAIAYLKLDRSKLITIHLGNGCSMTAVKDGKSIDHSMGFTPSTGLIMGSRSGDIDHSLIFYLVNTLGHSLDHVNQMLTKKSGMLGLTGFSDLRDIQTEASNGNRKCQLALEMNAYRIKKYIGAYTAAMNGLDAIVFTAGIGENSSILRNLVCCDMEYLGMVIDDDKNDAKLNSIREINTTASEVKILIVPTNEELEIANQAFNLCSKT